MADDPVDVEATLAEIGIQTRRRIDAHLSDRQPTRWLWDTARIYPLRPGKAIRPALCVAAGGAFGARVDDVMPLAAAIEMLHNGFLVHDDIQDGSLLRRGEPTLHEQVGIPLALNAGDALIAAALEMVDDSTTVLGSRVTRRIAGDFDRMLQHTVEGQAIELGWQRDVVIDLDADDYLDMIMRKTCWYTTIHPLRTGMLVGTLGRDVSPSLVRFGFCLGSAFQIQDDLLNLVGDEARYGKEILGDLYEGKRTLMLIHLLREANRADREELVSGYLTESRQDRTPDQIRHVFDLMQQYGSIDYARDFARGIRAAAFDAFEEAFEAAQPGSDLDFLWGMTSFMLDRTA
ncbi:polyprenyl synthetase family protein [Ilumatobacter nonamiensis]|uniref:polyprenyl synthetase family protein n=1 Tax=Ilumatobacter nonamiensis TaxID=467093 RepID=UPI000346A491|nr:polyprenyl synthetase family protein [Ilumatobacter nonamiensis]